MSNLWFHMIRPGKRMPGSGFHLLLAMFALWSAEGTLTRQAWAVTWCHDYTLHRATNRKQDFNRTSPTTLRAWLKSKGYKDFRFTTAAHEERAGAKLKPGDVIIFGDSHSAFVNEKGLVDHFIQTAGREGTAYKPAEVEKQRNFRRNDTLFKIVNTRHEQPADPDATVAPGVVEPYKKVPIYVWRRVAR